MLPLNNILIPVDFTHISTHAVRQAKDLARRSGAHLILFHAYHRPLVPVEVEPEVETSLMKKRIRGIDSRFKELETIIPDLKDVSFTCHKSLGKASDSIAKAVEKYNVDLILMGTKGAHGFEELWGSNAAKVVGKVDCPVLVLPEDTDISKIKKIGVACDFNQKRNYDNFKVLPYLAKVYNATVNIIFVSSNSKDQYPKEFKDVIKIHNMLEEVSHSFDYIYHKNVEDGLVNYCKKNKIGLLTVITKSKSFFTKLFDESLTTQMVYHIDVPLLIIK
ncbi:universal stress protein [Chondrinema litorale]|uniref:universal stress protein n=1 Tax=Chondrinema litorale TaxID=2994555 RepID=UPI002543AF23|nr:universal stress protein [Chondrinema litorale]UZR94980.1 universal stress protein [Chondrinema litorale]